MRGLIAILTLIVAIGGLLVVIGYAASDAYLTLRDDEANLYDTLLLDSIGSANWTATETANANYNQQFVTPCLDTPLLDGVGTSGRGAAQYLPEASAPAGLNALVLQMSLTDAQAVMSDVGRDTENNCQRGVTVGTVERATVETGIVAGADESVYVSFDRRVGNEIGAFIALIVRDGEYIGRLQVGPEATAGITAESVIGYAGDLVGRFENPPTSAQLEAAGIDTEPPATERIALRTSEETTSILTVSDRVPVGVGLGMFGGIVFLLYLIGARLSRTPAPVVTESQSIAMPLTSPSLSNYGAPERRWIKQSRPEPEPEVEVPVIQMESEPESNGIEEPSAPDAPPPVIDFPQKPIEEKLKILKEARLKEPRREHRPVREVTPDVDWTEEIYQSERGAGRPPAPAPARPEPPTRKALLKKLRSQTPEGQ